MMGLVICVLVFYEFKPVINASQSKSIILLWHRKYKKTHEEIRGHLTYIGDFSNFAKIDRFGHKK